MCGKQEEDLLNSEFLKQFKDSGELENFCQSSKTGHLKMLEGELDSHLGYEKYSPEGRNTGNSRNGKTEKKIKTEFGESEIEVPRDHDGSFEPGYCSQTQRDRGFGDITVCQGHEQSDIEEQLREINDFVYQHPLYPISQPRYIKT